VISFSESEERMSFAPNRSRREMRDDGYFHNGRGRGEKKKNGTLEFPVRVWREEGGRARIFGHGGELVIAAKRRRGVLTRQALVSKKALKKRGRKRGGKDTVPV